MFHVALKVLPLFVVTLALNSWASDAYAQQFTFQDTRIEFIPYSDAEYRLIVVYQHNNGPDVWGQPANYAASNVYHPYYGQITVFTGGGLVLNGDPNMVGVFGRVERRAYGGGWTYQGVVWPQ